MNERSIKKSFIFFIFSCLLFNAGCSYMVKNDKHQIYLKPRYGMDKFVAVQGYNLHYVEAGEGTPVVLIPGAFST